VRSTTLAGPGRALLFDPQSKKLVHVSDTEALVLDVEDSQLTSVRHAPPAGSEWRDAAYDDQGRLAVSYIRVEREPQRAEDDPDDPFRPGLAHVGIQLFAPATPNPVAQADWDVPLWNHSSPEIAFAANGRLYALVWPSAFEVPLP